MIEPMTIEDYDDVYRLWAATEGMGLRSLDDSRAGVTRFLARNPSTCFVARQAGGIVGCILSGHDGRRGYIYHTAVDKQLRGQGVGSKLVERALAALAAEGITRCGLFIYQENSAGQSFWRGRGWQARPDLVYFDLPLRPDNIMC